MRIVTTICCLLLVMALSGCQSTPGDAAYRSGHPQHAADLYKRGAEQGDPEAALKLGLLLHNGEAAPKVYGTAAHWFAQACVLGSNAGCHNLGVAFEYGTDGESRDLEAARIHYRKAAERGYMQSQYNLGSLYANRYFHDDIEGYRWILLATKAAEKCVSQPLCRWIAEDPPGHRETLRSRLSDEGIAKAEQWAAAWKPQIE